MTFPAGLALVTVSGQFHDFPAGGATGWVRFWYDSQLTGSTDHFVVPTINRKVDLEANGSFEVELPGSGVPGFSPATHTYQVLAQVGGVQRRGTVTLPYTDVEVWFDEVIQWDDAEVVIGTTYATLAQLNSGLATKAATVHTHTASQVTDFSSAASLAIQRIQRVVSGGELVLPRGEASAKLPMTSGRLYLSHFTGLTTQTIQSLETTTGDQGATGTDNAWVGILRWTGTQYDLDSVSVDDPTRWANPNTAYPTPLFQCNEVGLADESEPGFNEIAGQEYVAWYLWVGDGDQPQLWGSQVNPATALLTPRQNAYMELTAPPSSSLQAGWVAGVMERFQGLLRT